MKYCVIVFTLLALVCTGTSPIQAQGNGPYRIITRDNLDQLTQIAMLGRGSINQVAWSPDEMSLAVAGSAGLWLYNANDLMAEPQLIEETSSELLSVAFSPNATHIAAGTAQGSVFVWDAVTSQRLLDLQGFNQNAAIVAFSPDGNLLAAAGDDNQIRVWDIATGQLQTSTGYNYGEFLDLVFSPDGNQIAVASNDGTAWVWDTNTGEQVAKLAHDTSKIGEGLVPLPLPVEQVAFSTDSTTLLSVTAATTQPVPKGSTIWYWDIVSGEINDVWQDKTVSITEVYTTTSDEVMAVATVNNHPIIWNAITSDSFNELDPDDSQEMVNYQDYAVSADNTRLAASTYDGALTLWDVASSKLINQILPSRILPVDVAFSSDSSTIAFVDRQYVGLWDIKNQTLTPLVPVGTSTFESIAYSPDGQFLAAGDFEGLIWLWSTQSTTAPEPIGTLLAHNTTGSLVFAPESSVVASTEGNPYLTGTVRLWDMANKQFINEFEAEEVLLRALGFNWDGTVLATAAAGKVKLWDVSHPEQAIPLLHTIDEDSYYVESIALHPTTNHLVTCSSLWDDEQKRFIGHHLNLWDISSGTLQTTLIESDKYLSQPLYNLEGNLLVHSIAVEGDYFIQFRDSETGELLLTLEVSQTPWAFSPDGTMLLTSAKGTLRLWAVPIE